MQIVKTGTLSININISIKRFLGYQKMKSLETNKDYFL